MDYIIRYARDLDTDEKDILYLLSYEPQLRKTWNEWYLWLMGGSESDGIKYTRSIRRYWFGKENTETKMRFSEWFQTIPLSDVHPGIVHTFFEDLRDSRRFGVDHHILFRKRQRLIEERNAKEQTKKPEEAPPPVAVLVAPPPPPPVAAPIPPRIPPPLPVAAVLVAPPPVAAVVAVPPRPAIPPRPVISPRRAVPLMVPARPLIPLHKFTHPPNLSDDEEEDLQLIKSEEVKKPEEVKSPSARVIERLRNTTSSMFGRLMGVPVPVAVPVISNPTPTMESIGLEEEESDEEEEEQQQPVQLPVKDADQISYEKIISSHVVTLASRNQFEAIKYLRAIPKDRRMDWKRIFAIYMNLDTTRSKYGEGFMRDSDGKIISNMKSTNYDQYLRMGFSNWMRAAYDYIDERIKDGNIGGNVINDIPADAGDEKDAFRIACVKYAEIANMFDIKYALDDMGIRGEPTIIDNYVEQLREEIGLKPDDSNKENVEKYILRYRTTVLPELIIDNSRISPGDSWNINGSCRSTKINRDRIRSSGSIVIPYKCFSSGHKLPSSDLSEKTILSAAYALIAFSEFKKRGQFKELLVNLKFLGGNSNSLDVGTIQNYVQVCVRWNAFLGALGPFGELTIDKANEVGSIQAFSIGVDGTNGKFSVNILAQMAKHQNESDPNWDLVVNLEDGSVLYDDAKFKEFAVDVRGKIGNVNDRPLISEMVGVDVVKMNQMLKFDYILTWIIYFAYPNWNLNKQILSNWLGELKAANPESPKKPPGGKGGKKTKKKT